MDHSTVPLHAYAASIAFLSGDDSFATESFPIHASDYGAAHAIARMQAEASPYSNERVPDLRFVITVAPAREHDAVGDLSEASSS